MRQLINRLDALKVKRALAPGYYADGAGLYLQVGNSGWKSWIYRFTLDGRTRDMGLGSFITFGLAEARQSAPGRAQPRHHVRLGCRNQIIQHDTDEWPHRLQYNVAR